MARHSDDDKAFIRTIPTGTLEEFRAEMYREGYIKNNPAKFLTTDWVDVEDLKDFLRSQKSSPTRAGLKHDRGTSVYASPIIKEERAASPELSLIKAEPSEAILPSASSLPSAPLRTITENGHDYIVLSDDEDEPPSKAIVEILDDEDMGMSSDTAVGSFTAEPDSESEASGAEHAEEVDDDANLYQILSDDDFSDCESELESEPDYAPSNWLDPDVTSTIEVGTFKITREVTVSCIERVSGLPSYWPVPRDDRAYIVDLSDPKYNLKDQKDPNKLVAVDALIKNADQDSWGGCTGAGTNDSRPLTTVFNDSDDDEPIRCRRSRLACRGCSACEKANPNLINQERYELDEDILNNIIKLQFETRSKEADSPGKLALIFFAICNSTSCPATDDQGKKCAGVPILKKFGEGKTLHGHRYFVGCSKWKPSQRCDHRNTFLPDGVHDKDLAVLFDGGSLKNTDFLCGRIYSAHIGAKASHCNFPHNGDGSKAKVKQYKCPATRRIFVPLDESIRMACVVPDPRYPHNHPVLPPTKTPRLVKEAYKACVEKVGVIGATVRTVDTAPTTKIARAEDSSLSAPTLQNRRVKQDIIRALKKAKFPDGTDVAGVIRVLQDDLKKSLRERYIHGYATTATGGQIIFTANAVLLDRIHHAKTIFVDTTFKRSVGQLKEWEVAMFDNELQRALTIARVYSDRADRLQYKTIFDELQRVTFLLTGKRLRLKRLSKNGTLISVGVDLELSQALGAGDSFLHTNEPEFSGIHVETSEELLAYFIRACYTHATRGVEDLKPHVTDEEFERLRGFLYLESKEKVDEFSDWVKSLNNPKVQAWWDHKVVNTWILPALIKCLSKIDPDDWDTTASSTNVGESQHHYTNIHTGIQLSLLEAILKARELDESTASQVVQSGDTGVLKDSRGDTATRMKRSGARKAHAHKKASESRRKRKAQDAVDEELGYLKSEQQETAKKIRALKDEKAKLSGRKGLGASSKAESNSSGKVRVAGAPRTRRKRATSSPNTEPEESLPPKDVVLSSQEAVAPSSNLTALPSQMLGPSSVSIEDASLSDITSQTNLYPQSFYSQPPSVSSATSPGPPFLIPGPLPSALLSNDMFSPVMPGIQWEYNSGFAPQGEPNAAGFLPPDALYPSTSSAYYPVPNFSPEAQLTAASASYMAVQPDIYPSSVSNDILDDFLLQNLGC